MADLKIVENGPQAPVVNEFDPKALELEQKMQDLSAKLQKKKYRVKTTEPVMSYLMGDFYAQVKWNGYECYAISETHAQISKILEKTEVNSKGKLSFLLPAEILEALFHFVKQHQGQGLAAAQNHRVLAEDLSVSMAEMNTDRQELRDLATEAEAAKHGISVEDYKQAAAALQAQR